MEAKRRKDKFVSILEQLLEKHSGVKINLAKSLKIQPSTLTRWFQGKIDPASINLETFIRVAEAFDISTDQLARELGISDTDRLEILDKFKSLVKDLLSYQSLDQLGNKLGVSHGAIGGWISPQKNIDPRRIPISTIATLAKEKGWTIEQLLAYLDLKQVESIKQDDFTKIQTSVLQLPLIERARLLSWLSSDFEQQLLNQEQVNPKNNNLKKSSDRKIVLVLEVENITIATNYASNLAIHLNLKLENIKVTTIANLPDSIADIDILIFDISSPDSPSIPLIQEISFDGDIVVLTSEDLPENLRAGLEDKVTDLVIKPIDWSSLRDKEYFR